MKKSQWTPAIPKGAVIKDPCLIEIPRSFPALIYIPLDVCRKLDTDYLCPTYWNRDITLPPIPLKLLWALINQEEFPPPGHARQFQHVINESNFGIGILKKPTTWFAPGYFEVHHWHGTEDEAKLILE